MSLNWFNASVVGGINTTSFTGNFKIEGDIEVTGLVRRNGEIFTSITPDWTSPSTGKIYFNPSGDIPVFVGIGTSNPERTLDVRGDISYTGDLLKNGQVLNFGLGAWDGNTSGTIYYGGGIGNRVGVGVGFGPGINARGTLHVWSEYTGNETWEPESGLRIGPHEIGKPFTQMGVTNKNGDSWSWIQSANSVTLTDPTENRLLINPIGGNVGIGVTTSGIADATLSISSRVSNNIQASDFRKAIALGPETHDAPSGLVDYNNLIYSKRFAMGFRDTSDRRGLHIMTNTESASWKNADWENSTLMSVTETGEVGFGVTNPRLRLEVSSTSRNGILISDPNIPIGYGIQRLTSGLTIGPLINPNDSVVGERLTITNDGIIVNSNVRSATYSIGSNQVLSNGVLGPSILTSSLTSVGTLINLNVNGNVGVGTDAPSSKLDVRGDINFTGILRENGSPFQTGIGMFDWRTNDNSAYTSFNQRRITQVFGRFGLEPETDPSLGPFADFLYLNSWPDNTGGERNILAMSKTGPPAIRLYRTPFSDTLDRTNYRDVVLADQDGNVKKRVGIELLHVTGQIPYDISKTFANWIPYQSMTAITRAPSLGIFCGAFENISYTSVDGLNWVQGGNFATDPAPNTISITWSEELQIFIALRPGFLTGRSSAAYSVDGVSWSSASLSNVSFNKKSIWVKELGRFFGTAGFDLFSRGVIQTSTDGVNWGNANAPGSGYNDITWSSDLGILVAIGTSNYISLSSSGTSWTMYMQESDFNMRFITWSPKLSIFVTIGNNGFSYRSHDGINWIKTTILPNVTWGDIIWINELEIFIATGNNAVIVSDDGVEWDAYSSFGAAVTGILLWVKESGKLLTTGGSFISPSFYDEEYMRIGSSSISRPLGSAPLYMTRAWVNFDGDTSIPFIRNSGNISSVTRIQPGRFKINFILPMPDSEYTVVGSSGGNNISNIVSVNATFTTNVIINVVRTDSVTLTNDSLVNIIVIR